MVPNHKNTTNPPPTATEQYRTAVRAAWIAAAFCAAVLVLLLANQWNSRDLLDNPELLALKKTLQQNRSDERLKEQIRTLDQQIRSEMLRRREFSQTGAWILLAGFVVFLWAAKTAFTYREPLPMPQPGKNSYPQFLHTARLARWSVAALLGTALLAATGLLTSYPTNFSYAPVQVSAAEKTEPTAPPAITPAVQPAVFSMEEFQKNWPCFRGPQGLGISAYANVPTQWNGTTGEGILWKTEVPLPGNSSAIVWGNRVFVTGATKEKRAVFGFDADTGKILWQLDVVNIPGSPAEMPNIMEDTGYAAPTPATNGLGVFAIFPNGDVLGCDFEGRQLWARNLGLPDSMYGYASSLAIHKNQLIIQYDQGSADDGLSELIALDTLTGNDLWRTKRPVSASWTSPVIVEIEGTWQILTVAPPLVIAYHAENGQEIWRAECASGDVAPSPIYAGGLVFAIEPYSYLYALRTGGQGDITKTHIAWKAEDGIPDICSPVSNGEFVYLMDTSGLFTCYRTADGSKAWEKELDIYFHSSPSLVQDKLYLLSDEGEMIIAAAGGEYKEIARAPLGEKSKCCPAFLDGRMYIRGEKNLYCIGSPKNP